jgi:putative ABC transport system permease protein
VQRYVNEYPREPLLAILPGVALQELWDLIGVAEKALLAVSAFVVVVGLSGMLIALMTILSERRREMAILRSVGACPFHIFSLFIVDFVLHSFYRFRQHAPKLYQSGGKGFPQYRKLLPY